MKTIVVDSSVVVKWLHQEDEQYLEQANQLLDEAQRGETTLLAPELSKYEVGNAILFGKKVSLDEANSIFSSFYLLPIQFVPGSLGLANETYKIAQQLGITYYDASFMSLAKLYDAILVTDNIKHQGKDPEIKVVSLKDY